MKAALIEYLFTGFLILSLCEVSCPPRYCNGTDEQIAPANALIGHSGGRVVSPLTERVQLIRMDPHQLPDPVRGWIDRSRQLAAAGYFDTMEYDNKTFVFVARGERPTGGYAVRILDATRRRDNTIEIRVEFTRPPPDAIVTQAVTYPYDVVAINETALPLTLVLEGNDRPSRMTRLRGIDSLPDIVAQSFTIKIFRPAPLAHVERRFTLSGVALVPEGTVFYRVIDSGGAVRKVGGILSTSPLDWSYFESSLELPREIRDGESFRLRVYRFDDATGSEVDPISIDLVLME